MFRYIYVQQLNQLHQCHMINQLRSFNYLPLLPLLTQNTTETVTFKDKKATIRWHSEHIFGKEDCISASINIQSVRLVIFPLSIEVFSVRKVNQSCSLHLVLLPIRHMKCKVIINHDS